MAAVHLVRGENPPSQEHCSSAERTQSDSKGHQQCEGKGVSTSEIDAGNEFRYRWSL